MILMFIYLPAAYNESFKKGGVNTGLQDVPAAKVSKWRGNSSFCLGSAVWKVDINFNVDTSGKVKTNYCLLENDASYGHAHCVPYKADVSAKYFETRIKEKF